MVAQLIRRGARCYILICYTLFPCCSFRMLLWHGSRLTNWVGILSQGLRIAPPEAPVTGYMVRIVKSVVITSRSRTDRGLQDRDRKTLAILDLLCRCPRHNAGWGDKVIYGTLSFYIPCSVNRQDEPIEVQHCDWVPERARWCVLTHSLLPAVSHKKKFFSDQACSVKIRRLEFGLASLSQPQLYLASYKTPK